MSESEYYVRIKLTADISQAVSGLDQVGSAVTALVEKMKAMRAAGEDMKSMTLDFAKTGGSNIKSLSVDFENATTSVQKTSSTIHELVDKLGFMGRVAAGITVAMIFFETARAITQAVESMKEAERILAALAAIQADTSQEAAQLKQQFMDTSRAISGEFGMSISDAARGLEALIKAGVDTDDALKTLRNVAMMAKIEATDLGTAARNTAMVMAQFGLSADQSARAINALITMSRLGIGTASDFARGLGVAGTSAHMLGLTLEETGTFMVALERRLGSAEEAGVRFNRALLELYEVAIKLGVPVRDAEGNLRSVTSVLMDNIEKIRELSGNYELLSQKLVGVNERTIQFYRIMASVSSEELNKIRSEFEKTARNIDTVWLDSMKNLQTRTDIIWQNMANRIGEFGSNVLSAFTNMAYGMAFSFGLIDKNFTTIAIRLIQLSERLGAEMSRAMATGTADATKAIVKEMEQLIASMARLEIETRGSTNTTQEFVNTLNVSAEIKQRLIDIINQLAGRTEALIGVTEQLGNSFQNTGDEAAKTALILDTLINILNEIDRGGKELAGTLKDMINTSDPMLMIIRFLEWAKSFDVVKTRMDDMKKHMDEIIRLGTEGWKKYGEDFQKFVLDAVAKGKISAEEAINIFKLLHDVLGDVIPLNAITNLINLADNERKAADEAEKLKKELERLKEEGQKGANSIMEIVNSFFEGGKSAGMFSSQLKRISDIIDDLNKKGIKLDFSQALKDVLAFIEEVNKKTIEINIMVRGLDFAASVAGAIQQAMRFTSEYTKTTRAAGDALKYVLSVLREKNALSKEEAANVERALQFLEREHVLTREEAMLLREAAKYREQGLKLSKEWIKVLEDIEERQRGTNRVSWETTATIERLGRIQQAASIQGGFLNLTLQALQLAFFGGKETAKMVIPYLQGMNKALEDGYIAADEEVEILKTLGITFNEQGEPVFNFTGMLNTLIETIQNTVDKIGGLIDALNSIPTNIVITITTNYTTSGQGQGQESGQSSGGFTGAPGDFWGDGTVTFTPAQSNTQTGYQGAAGDLWSGGSPTDIWGYQRGAWFTREGLAYLHRGEMVLPQPVAEWFRRWGGLPSQMASNINVNLNISAIGDAKKTAEIVSREIMKHLRSIRGGYV